MVSSDIYAKFYTEMDENIEEINHKKIVWKKNAAKEILSTQCDKEVAMLMDMACKKTSLFCPRPAHFMLLAHFLAPITVLFWKENSLPNLTEKKLHPISPCSVEIRNFSLFDLSFSSEGLEKNQNWVKVSAFIRRMVVVHMKD